MGLFTVVCETCQARLTVRERSLIGQIVECPKCGSMVGIFPPPGWQPGDEPAASSQPSASTPPTRTAETNGKPTVGRDGKLVLPSSNDKSPSHDQALSRGAIPEPPGSAAKQPPTTKPAARRTAPGKNELPAQADAQGKGGSSGKISQPAQPKQPSKTSPAKTAPATALGANLAQVADVGLDLSAAPAPKLPASQRVQSAAPPTEAASNLEGFGDSLDEWAVERGAGPSPLEDLDKLPDWYTAQSARRWIWISAAAAAGLVLLVGSWLVFRGGSTSQPPAVAEATAPAQQHEPAQPIETPQVTPPAEQQPAEPNVPPQMADMPPAAGEPSRPTDGAPLPRNELPDELPAAWEPRWLPPTTAAVLTIRPSALASQPLFPAELASASPEQWRLIGPVTAAFGLEPHEIARITWAVVEDQLSNTLNPRPGDNAVSVRRSIIAIELVPEAEPAAQRLAKAQPIDLKLGTSPCRMLDDSPWPFPFALVQERTILTGPSDLLQSLNAVEGTPAGLRSQALQTLLPRITSVDQFAGVIDNRATGWLPQVPAIWLPVGPARVAWGRLGKAPAVGFALRTADTLAVRLYALGGTPQEAVTLTGDLEALLSALARMTDPPAWWPKLPGDTAPAVPTGPAPPAVGVDMLARMQGSQQSSNRPGSAFELPGLPGQPDKPATQQGETNANQPQALTGSQVWRMLSPLWQSAKAATEDSVAEVQLAVQKVPAAESSLALFTLARNTAEEPQLTDTSEPGPEPAQPLEPDNEPEPEMVAPHVDIAERLNDPVAGVGFQQVALADALDVFSELSQIPLAFDFAAIQAAGASPSDPVDLSAKDTTVAGAIESLLAKKKLTAVPKDRYVLITADPPPTDQPESRAYPVDDLITPAGDAPALAALVRQFVAPQSWENGGGQGRITVEGTSLRVEQPVAIQWQVARFLDQLRAARNKPPRTGVALPQPSLQTPFAAAASRLNKQVTANFVVPTPLRQVLRYLQAQSGVRVVLDAASLPETVWAERPVKLSATNEPMAAVVARLADSLGVGLRIVDGQTIELMGKDRLAAELETAFYSLSGLTGTEPAAAWADRVRREVQPDKWNQPTNPPAAVVDESSQTLIVRQDQPTQVAIELWLQGQRQGKP